MGDRERRVSSSSEASGISQGVKEVIDYLHEYGRGAL